MGIILVLSIGNWIFYRIFNLLGVSQINEATSGPPHVNVFHKKSLAGSMAAHRGFVD